MRLPTLPRREREHDPGEDEYGFFGRQRYRRVRKRMLEDPDPNGEGEVIITDGQVHHHWVVYTVPVLECVAAVFCVLLALFGRIEAGWFFTAVAVGLLGHAGLRALSTYMDVFVITNFRVFRVSGLGPTKYATTPLSRILDITVDQTSLGLLLRYGHFTFESAAQEQGLRDVKFVSRPLDRDRIIQEQQLRLLRRQRRS